MAGVNVRYLGSDDPTEDRVCEVYGGTFPVGDWVEVDDPKVVAKLAGNPMFETDQDGDGEADPAIADIKAQLDALGVTYRANTGLPRLAEKLAEARAAAGLPE